jgi:Cu-processing system ATP-binding protein
MHTRECENSMIRINNLHKRFGEVEVLKALDLVIPQSGIFVVLGPNGSGKTTLIKSLLGMVIPDQGEIAIDDRKILGEYAYRGNIDYLPQIANFPANLKVAELLRMIKTLRARPTREAELIERFGLTPFLDKKLGHLSGGTKQKVNLVLAFMFDSPLVVLDEPTAGLDPVSLVALKELIQEQKQAGKTVLITTHIMSFVEEVADEIVFLLDGQIHFQGTVEEIKTQTEAPNLEHAIAAVLEESHV